MKYRKKPVEVEAEQYHYGKLPYPEGVVFRCYQSGCPLDDGKLFISHIHTAEGPLHVSNADWIITGVKGERYPCKPDIFEATYEALEE